MTQDPNQSQQPYTPPQGNPYAPYGMYDPSQHAGQYAGMYGMPMNHGGLGIASFIIALIAGLGLIATVIALAVFISKNGPNFDQKNPPPELIGPACGMFSALGVALVGGILGIVAVNMRHRKRLFGVLGLCLNGGILLLFAILFLIGLVRR